MRLRGVVEDLAGQRAAGIAVFRVRLMCGCTKICWAAGRIAGRAAVRAAGRIAGRAAVRAAGRGAAVVLDFLWGEAPLESWARRLLCFR